MMAVTEYASFETFRRAVCDEVKRSLPEIDALSVTRAVDDCKPKLITHEMGKSLHRAHYHRRSKLLQHNNPVKMAREERRAQADSCQLCVDALESHKAFWISSSKRLLARQLGKKDESLISCEICASDDVHVRDATQCTEGHLFCKICARKMAEIQIGMQRVKIACMSFDGCDADFPEAEMRRFLRPQTMDLWIRLRAREDLCMAKIDGLVQCPFCDFAVIIEGDVGRTLTCGNPTCSVVSCLLCKQRTHPRQTCDDARLNGNRSERQKAEDELAKALIRYCPGCSLALIKEEDGGGCNKMECAKCKTLSCYVCRKDITREGYDHFASFNEQRRGGSSKTCLVYDSTIKRHAEELQHARERLDPRFANI
jgi:hypothetical protein